MKQRTGMIIFVVVVVVVVVLFACVKMQRKKELICELKKKIRVSICLSLHFSITRAACLYIACDSILFWYAQFSVFVSPTSWERTVVVEEVLYTFGVFVLVSVSYGLRVPRRFGGFV